MDTIRLLDSAVVVFDPLVVYLALRCVLFFFLEENATEF